MIYKCIIHDFFVVKCEKPLGSSALSAFYEISPQTYPQKMCTTQKCIDDLMGYVIYPELGLALEPNLIHENYDVSYVCKLKVSVEIACR